MTPGKPTIGPEDPDLAQVEQAYRRLGAEQPPELLDQAVLNRARRAPERRRPWSWNLPWYHTVGTAAGVLLAVGIFLQMRSETPRAPSFPVELRDGARLESELGKVSEAMPEAEPIDEVSLQRADRAAAADAFARPANRNEAPPAGAPAEERIQLQAKQAVTREKPDRESPLAPARVSATPVVAAEDEEDDGAVAQPDAEGELESAGDERVQRVRQTELKAEDRRDPEAWLQELRRLLEAGDEEAFLEQLEAFRAAYPDHPLPEDWPG